MNFSAFCLKRTVLTLFVLFFLNTSVFSQSDLIIPIIGWDRTYGGSSTDTDLHVIKTTDSGFLFGTSSKSGVTGTKTTPKFGSWDWWIYKTDSQGDVEWDFGLGGAGEDGFRGALAQSNDGHYLLAGHVAIGITDKITSEGLGGRDVLLVKLSAVDQSILWQTRIGGDSNDVVYDMIETSSGEIYVVGYTQSNDLNGYPNRGSLDLLVSKVSQSGQLLWTKTFGGSGFESADRVVLTAEEDIVIGGYSNSTDMAVKNYGNFDYWLLKLDPDGELIWEKMFGGSQLDAVRSLGIDPSGDIVVGGESFSGADGSKLEESRGIQDIWVLKVDVAGNELWQKTIGGTGYEQAQDLQVSSDGKILVGGYSNSGIEGEKTISNFGGFDIWYMQLSQTGDMLWQNTFGGAGTEAGFDLVDFDEQNHRLVFAGTFDIGNSGDISGQSYGASDLFITEAQIHSLSSAALTIEQFQKAFFTLENGIIGWTYAIKDSLGNTILEEEYLGQNLVFELSGFNELGVYPFELYVGETTAEQKMADLTVTVIPDQTPPVLYVDPVTADNVINKFEKYNGVSISGTTEGVEDGQLVTIELCRTVLTAEVQGGIWTLDLPSSVLRKIFFRTQYLVANVIDKSGNAAPEVKKRFKVDIFSPVVFWIKRLDKEKVKYANQKVRYLISFSEQVVGFDESDLSLKTTKSASAKIESIKTWNNRSFVVSLSEFEGKGNLNLYLTDNETIFDRAGNPLRSWKSSDGSFMGPSYELKIKKRKGRESNNDWVDELAAGETLSASGNTEQLIVYPNPATSYISIDLSAFDAQSFELIMVNTLGQVTKQSELEGGRVSRVNVNDQTSGLFTIRVRSMDHQLSRKVLIKR